MATLESEGFTVVTLPTKHVIPRTGKLTCDNATIDANWHALSGPVLAGQIKMVRDPEPVEEPEVEEPAAKKPAKS